MASKVKTYDSEWQLKSNSESNSSSHIQSLVAHRKWWTTFKDREIHV